MSTVTGQYYKQNVALASKIHAEIRPCQRFTIMMLCYL